MLVYEIKGPTGKVYIGATICKLNKRIREHRHASKTLEYPLYKDIVKYGWDAFTAKEVCYGSDKEYMYDLESHMIKSYKAENKSYNIATYKTKGYKLTKEQRHSMSEASKKRFKDNPEAKKKMSEIAKEAWNSKGFRYNASIKRKEWCLNNFDKMDAMRQKSSDARAIKRKWFIVEYKDGTFFGRYKDKHKCANDIGISYTSLYRYFKKERSHKTFNFRYEEF